MHKFLSSIASYLNIIDHLKKVIKASGRKAYFFVMGKLNVAKMANFMEIDCYVLVSCPENSLIDSKVCVKSRRNKNKPFFFVYWRVLFFMSTGVLPPNCNTIRIRDCSYQVLLNLYMHEHVYTGNNINFFFLIGTWNGLATILLISQCFCLNYVQMISHMTKYGFIQI